MAAARLHRLQEEYKERLTVQWRSFLLFREDAHKGWNGYVAAHWHKAQEAEPTLTFTPWRGASYPTTTLPAHITGKAAARQDLFDAFHLEAMRTFFSLNQNLEDPAVLRQVARNVGADLDRFDQDTADPELKELVWREFTTGVERDRVTAIPTLFAGERRVVEGALSLERYRQLFDSVLAEAERSV
ncbi:MAG: DsbA family protein [Deltaproteobacteria bacterium]|nr:DsbA family protein [Deltaproteobacteria bacterium]